MMLINLHIGYKSKISQVVLVQSVQELFFSMYFYSKVTQETSGTRAVKAYFRELCDLSWMWMIILKTF